MSEPDLDRLLSELEIRAVLARYARGVDRLEWDLVRSCYHPDATEHHGSFGEGSIEEFIEWAAEKLAAYESSSHHLTNQLLQIDGDLANSETYCVATHRRAARGGHPARDEVANVRYLDRFERRRGSWRIGHRVCVFDPGRIDPVGTAYPLSPSAARGARGEDDPSFGIFRG